MINRVALLVAAFAMLSASTLSFGNFKQGDWELTLGGSGSNDNDFDAGGGSVSGSLGYFLTDNFEIALRQTVSYANTGDDSAWNGSTRGAIDFHFDLGRWQPFIGVNIGYLYGDNTTDTWEAAPEGGVKYFVNDTTFIFAMAEYQFFFRDAGDADEAFDDGQFVYSLGLGFRW